MLQSWSRRPDPKRKRCLCRIWGCRTKQNPRRLPPILVVRISPTLIVISLADSSLVHEKARTFHRTEVLMRSRLVALTLTCYLIFTLMACNSRPPANDAGNAGSSSPGSSTDANNPANGNSATPGSQGGNSGGGMASGKSAMQSPTTRQPLVVPSATVLTVRLGEG